MDRARRVNRADSLRATSPADATTAALLPPPARVLQFDAHLVLADTVTTRLRQSSQTGVLSINTTDRTVLYSYRRNKRGSFVRTLHAPHKCVVATLGMQIWSRTPPMTVRCRFVSARDLECCLEVLQIMGVRVVDVSPHRFIRELPQNRREQHPDHGAEQYTAEFDSLSTALAHPQQSRGITARVAAYSSSDQLADDVAVISRSFFGGSLFRG